jgi:vacuolar-type H+-ATPase subunit E/Vma4
MSKLRRTLNATINAEGIRTETLEGVEYLVAPVTMLVEGVHAGNKGPAYYPPTELEAAVPLWNGVPIVVNHPITQDGRPASANSPEVIAAQGVGRVFNVSYEADGTKLKGEAWVNVEKAESIHPELISLIRHGGRLEVSTAFLSNDEIISGVWNNETYNCVVHDIAPDHLAILSQGSGACSWDDGCGIRINVRSSARTPSFEGTETTSWAGVTKTFSAFADAYYKSHGGKPDNPVSQVADAPAAMKNWIASKTLLGEGTADNERDLLFFPVVNPNTGKLNEGALRAVLGGRGSQANIPEAAKTSAQTKARSLLNEHFDANLQANAEVVEDVAPTLWRAALRKLHDWLSGTQNEQSHDDLRRSLQNAVRETLSGNAHAWVRDVFDDYLIYEVSEARDGLISGAEKLYKRGYMVDAATGEVTLGENVVEVMEETRYVPIGSTTNEGIENKADNPDVKEDEMDRDKFIGELIANEATQFTEADKEWLNSLDDCRLKQMQPKPKEVDPPKSDPTINDGGKTEPKEPAKDMTMDEYIASAPKPLRDPMRRMYNRAEEERTTLIKAITENKRNKFTEEKLKEMSTDDLEALAAFGNIEVDRALSAGGPPSPTEHKRVPDPEQLWPVENSEGEKKQEGATA